MIGQEAAEQPRRVAWRSLCAVMLALVLACSRKPAPAPESGASSPDPQASVAEVTEPAPVATVDPSIQEAWERLGAETPSPPGQEPPVPDTAPASAAPIQTLPQALPEPNPSLLQESEIDTKRRVGAVEFAREVAALSSKADQADVAWERFRAGCRANVTSVTAVAGVADRDWIAFAGVNVATTQWTEACAEAGTFFALVRQVRDGMCGAEDRARQHWVYPGTRRDIRHRYRLNWEGWDATCR